MQIPANTHELHWLRQEKIPYRLLKRDLAQDFVEQLEKVSLVDAQEPPLGFGSIGGYYTYTEIGEKLDELHSLFPNVIGEKISIGLSWEGREIWAVRISNRPEIDQQKPRSYFDAMHHPREPMGMMTLLHFMYELGHSYGSDPFLTQLVDQREIWCIPCVNPDGYVYNQQTDPLGGGLWRYNRRPPAPGVPEHCAGVDLNRNYPIGWGVEPGSSSEPCNGNYRGTAPFSEPETQALSNFYLSHAPFGTSDSIHTFGKFYVFSWGFTNLESPSHEECFLIGNWHTQENHYTVGPLYSTIFPASGVAVDWAHVALGSHSFTSEIGTDFWPTPDQIVPIATENLNQFARLVASAGPYVRMLSHSVREGAGNHDLHINPQETGFVSVLMQNFGVLTTGPITLRLRSNHPHVSIIHGESVIPSLAAFASQNSDFSQLEFALSCELIPESVIVLELDISHDGFFSTREVSVFVEATPSMNPYELNGNYPINVFDFLCLFDGFASMDSCPQADVAPCGGDGIINLADILAEIRAFQGDYACPMEQEPCE